MSVKTLSQSLRDGASHDECKAQLGKLYESLAVHHTHSAISDFVLTVFSAQFIRDAGF